MPHCRRAGSITTQSSFHTAQQEHFELNDEADDLQMSGSNPPSTPTRPQARTLKRMGSDISSQLSAPLERISTPDRRWLEEFIDNDDESLLTFTTHTTKTSTKYYGDENEEHLPQAVPRNYPASPQRSILSAGSTLFGLDVLSTTQSTFTASSDASGIPPPLPPAPTPQGSTLLDSEFLITQQQPNTHSLNLREQMEAARQAQERMRDEIGGTVSTDRTTTAPVPSKESRVVSPEPRSDKQVFGIGEDPINQFLRSCQKEDASNHYISDTDDDDDSDDGDDDAEDNPAIIHNIHTHSIIDSQLSSEEQEVARMTAKLSTQCDLYQKKISTSLADGISVASGTSASIRRSSAVPRRGPKLQTPTTATNSVRIHVYDLLPKDAEIELFSWGCHVPIGQCFVTMNDGLHALGSGAYHVGVEVNGVEFAYGANDVPSLSGVFTCHPRSSPGYQYRTTLDFGDRISSEPRGDGNVYDGQQIMQGMAREYLGCDYDLLRRNCCTFARDACLRLGVTEDEIPSWFLHLSSAGAEAHDAMTNFQEAAVDRGVEPLKRMLSLENTPAEGRRRRHHSKSGRTGKDGENTVTANCGRSTNGSAIDSVVNAIGRSLCFGPQLLASSCTS